MAAKVKDFIEATDIDMWDLIKNGYQPPMTIINNIPQPKPISLWTNEEKSKYLIALKVKWIITNSFTPSKYERISNDTIAKEVWDILEVTHIGTTQVKGF